MAFSKSIVRSQIPIQCQLCEDNSKIKWKCIDCNLLMCKTCPDKLHLKFKNARKHKILDIKDVLLPLEDEDDDSGIEPHNKAYNCKIHRDKIYCLFCTSCNELVCGLCVSDSHQKHDLVDMDSGLTKKVEHIRGEKSKNLHRNIEAYNESLSKLDAGLGTEYDIYLKAADDIQSRRNTLLDEVEKHSNTLLDELDKIWIAIQSSVNDEKKRVDRIVKNYADKLKSMEKEEDKKTNMSTAFYRMDDLAELLEFTFPQVRLQHGSMPKFIPGKLDLCASAFGSLNMEKKSEK